MVNENQSTAQGYTNAPNNNAFSQKDSLFDLDMTTDNAAPSPTHVPLTRQFYWLVRKNILLMLRRPIMLFFMLFSSVFSVLLAWPAGRDVDPSKYPDQKDFDQCGVVPGYVWEEKFGRYNYYSDEQIINLSHSWNNGLAVSVLSLGAFVHATCVFLLLHSEKQLKLDKVIRSLGVRDLVYWLSWHIALLLPSLLNALFGAITAQFLPVHLFQNVYFGGIFGSIFFLHIALTSASFFLASICGSNSKILVLSIILMAVSVFIPTMINVFTTNVTWASAVDEQISSYPWGLFGGLSWTNMNTLKSTSEGYYNYTSEYDNETETWIETGNDYVVTGIESCNYPLMSEEEGTWYRTEEETLDIEPDDFFVGCYIHPGFTSAMWNPDQSISLVAQYMLPYFHLTSIYSNFIGYSGHPGKRFTSAEANMSPEELAKAVFPVSSDDSASLGTTLLPQGSTLSSANYYDWNEYKQFRDMHKEYYQTNYYTNWNYATAYTCPSTNFTEYNICSGATDCNYVKKSKPLAGSPSVHDLFGHLIFLSVVYTTLALVWAQFFSERWRIFSCFKSKQKNEGMDEYTTQNVFIDNVCKNYGSCKAVKSMSLELKKGQITALLGHNGAGKSTLTNILSCEAAPSSGEVLIYGRSVVHDTLSIRRLMGICKQDDYLWPNLTAKEHLDVFAGLRGVTPECHDDSVQKWLDSVDLSINQHTMSAAFSGGMKRRLSVALSTIGSRPFLIFDEPTTGMDPVSRRSVWKHLDEIKEDKVILLTTHAMEEADLLADEVAIMKKGELAVVGSPLELKSGHGSAIQFNLLVDKGMVEETKNMMSDIFSEYMEVVNVSSGDSGNISVKIESVKIQSTSSRDEDVTGVDVAVLTKFVEWLENDNNHVREYGFSNSSLEEVFIKITQDSDHEETRDETTFDGDNQDTDDIQSDVDFEQNHEYLVQDQPKLTLPSQVRALVRLNFVRKWVGLRRSLFEYIFFGAFAIGTFCLNMQFGSLKEGYEVVSLIGLQIIPIAGLSLILVSTVLPTLQDKSLGLFHLMRTQGLFHTSYIVGTALYSFTIQLVYGVIIMTLIFATPMFRETRRCDYFAGEYSTDDVTFENREPFICERPRYWVGESIFGRLYQSTGTVVSAFNDNISIDLKVVDSPGGYWQIIIVAFLWAFSMPGAIFCSFIIPGNYKFCTVLVGCCTVVAFIFPVVYYSYTQYRAVEYFYVGYYDDDDGIGQDDMITSCLKSINPNNICSNLDVDNVSQEQFLDCLGYEMLRESILGSYCTPSYVSLLPQYGAFQIIVFALFSKAKFWPESISTFKNLFPNDQGFCNDDLCSIPFVRKAYRENLLFFFLGATILNVVGLGLLMIKEFPPSFLLKIKNILCKIKVFRTHENQIKNETNENNLENEEVAKEEEDVIESLLPIMKPFTNDDVEANEQAIEIDRSAKSLCSNLPPILMRNLRKVYPRSGRSPPKVAVEALNLQVRKGEVCGLLGKNGSGKTTVLKILSCDHEASSGLACVAGYDVSCEKIQVFENLGNCPQFDVVWPSLSVREHLEFFSRLKGFVGREVARTSHTIAKAVGLGEIKVYNRRARDLSGGMRRRLSIAISLLGGPGVFLLDEPTTGLDPNTRNKLWNLLTSFATPDRAIIITTHMMIEADTLCNRIAIIGQGRLKVVATQQKLKDKYGSGYVLQLNLINSSLENQDKAMAFVRNYLHKEATLDHKQAKTLHVHLPNDINLTDVFTKLYSRERITEGFINQFLLSQSSLEDVFLALGD